MTPALEENAPCRAGAVMLTPSVSAHHVRAALFGAERRGVAAATLLARAGLPETLLAEDRVPTEQFSRLVKTLWATLDDELIGFGTAPSKVGTFAMMCHAVVHGSGDLRTALRRGQAFYSLFPAGPRFRLAESGSTQDDEAYVELDVSDYDDPLHFATETTAVVAHRFGGWLIRRRIGLRRVEFAYPAPVHVREYDLMFGAPCVFGAPRTGVVFDRGLLDEPVLQDEAGLKAFLRRAPVDVLARVDYGSTVTTRIRQLVGQALPGPIPTPEQIAQRLSVSPQTLRRRLAAEGTTFQRVRDQVRRDHAIAVLADGKESIEQLSHQLGFSEPSAFHRAFRRWTGSTPRAYQPGHRQ